MDSQQQQFLKRTLLEGGMPAWRVERTVDELADHYLDIQEEALAAGLSDAAARAEAIQRIGKLSAVAEQLLVNRDLCDWSLLAGIENHAYAAESAIIKRWFMAISMSAIATASLLFVLHLAIFY